MKALLVAVVIAASFLGGMRFGEHREKSRRRQAELRELEEYGQIGATVHLKYPKKNGSGLISRSITQILPSDEADWPTAIPAAPKSTTPKPIGLSGWKTAK